MGDLITFGHLKLILSFGFPAGDTGLVSLELCRYLQALVGVVDVGFHGTDGYQIMDFGIEGEDYVSKVF